MLRFIIFIIIVFIISRLIDAARRRQINAQRRSQQDEKPETSVYREKTRIVTVPEYDKEAESKLEKVSLPSVIEKKSYDEEMFDEESSEVRTQQPKQALKVTQTVKRKPVTIAGIPINSETIAQGIVISEILKRPDF